MFPQEVEEKMKTMSPVMFKDFVKPFQVNFEEVLSRPPYCIKWFKKIADLEFCSFFVVGNETYDLYL